MGGYSGGYYQQPDSPTWPPPYRGPASGRQSPEKQEKTPKKDSPAGVNDSPSAGEKALLLIYGDLRLDCDQLEEMLGAPSSDLTEKDLKRLDKAVTIIKVGFKLIKKVLRAHGYVERLKPVRSQVRATPFA